MKESTKLLISAIQQIADICIASYERELCQTVLNHGMTFNIVHEYSGVIYGDDMFENLTQIQYDGLDTYSPGAIYELVAETVNDNSYENYPLHHADLNSPFVLNENLKYHSGNSRLVTYDKYDCYQFYTDVLEILKSEAEYTGTHGFISESFFERYLKTLKIDLEFRCSHCKSFQKLIDVIESSLKQWEQLHD